MPLEYVSVKVVRRQAGVTATMGLTQTEVEIPGSPFTARVYRMPQTTVQRDEAGPGVATVDEMRRLSIHDRTAVIMSGDIATLPSDSDPSQTVRAKVIRPRRYGDRVQCDLEVGAE